MRPLDHLKAFGVAIAILVANVAILVVTVFVYRLAFAPGHDSAFYSAAAPRIAGWSAPIGGSALFFGVGTRSRRVFILETWGIYVMLDIATGGLHVDLQLMVSLFAAGIAGVLGSVVNQRRLESSRTPP